MPNEYRPKPPEQGRHVGWRHILPLWHLVQADLAALYGVHEWASDMPFPVLRGLIFTLLGEEHSRLRAALLDE